MHRRHCLRTFCLFLLPTPLCNYPGCYLDPHCSTSFMRTFRHSASIPPSDFSLPGSFLVQVMDPSRYYPNILGLNSQLYPQLLSNLMLSSRPCACIQSFCLAVVSHSTWTPSATILDTSTLMVPHSPGRFLSWMHSNPCEGSALLSGRVTCGAGAGHYRVGT